LRLHLNFCISHAAISGLFRLYVIHHQYYGPNEKVATADMIACSLIREAFMAYFTSLYERGGRPTTIFFVVVEMIHLSSTYSASFLVVYGYSSDIANLVHDGMYMLAGLVFCLFVYRSDNRELEKILKRGTSHNSYSITRSYQLRENINLIKMFSRITVPLWAVSWPPFLLYPAFALITRYDHLRYYSIAFYDVNIPIIVVVVIVSVPLCQPQIAKHMPVGLRFSFFEE
ncbi:hypothetical protein PENTCL1PPCAC_15850, partial [Pristionchus entomophagus]